MDRTWWRSARELDQDQRAIIEISTDYGNHLVTGPPGCGKTNILLLRASYLRSAGFGNCAILVFTKTLREFIATGSSQSAAMLPPDRIQTHASWTLRLLGRLGRQFELSREDLSYDEARAERHQALERAVQEAGLGHDYYDSILLDEAQDYWACEVELLSRLTRRLFAVGDRRQRIYSRNEGIQAARGVGCNEMQLRNHYRMGREICRVADRLLPTEGEDRLEQYCQYDEHELPSRVSVHPEEDVQRQLARLKASLDEQVRAYPDEWLGVLAVRRETRDTVAEFLRETELGENVILQSEEADDRSFDPERRVVVSTLHSAKGTEFRSVHLIAADDFPYYTREKAFTAVTRAKTTFDVYHSRTLEGALESALATPAVPDLNGILS